MIQNSRPPISINPNKKLTKTEFMITLSSMNLSETLQNELQKLEKAEVFPAGVGPKISLFPRTRLSTIPYQETNELITTGKDF